MEDHRFQSAIDSVLGNIGGPLRVSDDLEDGEEDEVQAAAGEGDRFERADEGVDPLNMEAVNEGPPNFQI